MNLTGLVVFMKSGVDANAHLLILLLPTHGYLQVFTFPMQRWGSRRLCKWGEDSPCLHHERYSTGVNLLVQYEGCCGSYLPHESEPIIASAAYTLSVYVDS